MLVNPLDIFVFVSLTFLTLAYTIFLSKNNNSENISSYLIFSRKLTMPLFVSTLVPTWYGDIFGITQIAFKIGLNATVLYVLGFYLSAILFAVFFVEKLKNTNVMTLPEIIKEKYGTSSYKLVAIMILLKSLPISYVISIGLLINQLFGWSLNYSMIVGISFVVACIGLRGLGGIVYSDVIQFIIMYLSIIIVSIFSVRHYGGYSFLIKNFNKGSFFIEENKNLSQTFVWFFIPIFTTFMSPIFYQRCFAAKNTEIAKKGIFISVLFWIICDFCTISTSIYVKIIYPDVLPHEAYFKYSMNILPFGLKGLFLSGMAATILSTLDSFLFISSSTLTYDLLGENFYKKQKYRIFSLIFAGFITFILASHFIDDLDIFYKIVRSYCSITIGIPIILSVLFEKLISEKQFLYIVFITCLLIATCDFYKVNLYVDNFYYSVLISLFVTLISIFFNRKRKIPLSC